MRVEPQAFGSGWVSFLVFAADPGTRRQEGAVMHESQLMGGTRRALVVAGAVFSVALLSAALANAADPVQLRSRLGDWCLDGPGNNTATVVNPCNGSNSQRWVLNSVGQIESAAFPGHCVSIADAADNTPV